MSSPTFSGLAGVDPVLMEKVSKPQSSGLSVAIRGSRFWATWLEHPGDIVVTDGRVFAAFFQPTPVAEAELVFREVAPYSYQSGWGSVVTHHLPATTSEDYASREVSLVSSGAHLSIGYIADSEHLTTSHSQPTDPDPPPGGRELFWSTSHIGSDYYGPHFTHAGRPHLVYSYEPDGKVYAAHRLGDRIIGRWSESVSKPFSSPRFGLAEHKRSIVAMALLVSDLPTMFEAPIDLPPRP